MISKRATRLKLVAGETITLPIDKVLPDPANETVHPERQIEMLRGSLRKFGQQKAVLIDTKGILICGHGVREAMLAEDMVDIRCEVSGLTAVDQAGYRVADNQLNKLSFFDEEILRANLAPLVREAGFDSEVLGFESAEWEQLLAGTWNSKPAIDPDTIGDYDPNAETFVIKIVGVKAVDRDRVLQLVTKALKGTEYEAESY
ncbi:MAG: hypothetical protein ABIP75_03130 [Pyrinomonadaceae bacterium]